MDQASWRKVMLEIKAKQTICCNGTHHKGRKMETWCFGFSAEGAFAV